MKDILRGIFYGTIIVAYLAFYVPLVGHLYKIWDAYLGKVL